MPAMAVSYAKEIRVVLIAALCGLFLLVPRIVLVQEVVPSLMKFVDSSLRGMIPGSVPDIRKAKIKSAVFKSDIKIKRSSRALSPMRLEGIIFDAQGDSSSLINGQILVTGDEVEGFKVLKILADRVIVEKENAVYILTSESGLRKVRAGRPARPSEVELDQAGARHPAAASQISSDKKVPESDEVQES